MKSIILNCLALPLSPLPGWFPKATVKHEIETVAHTCPNPAFYANIFKNHSLESPNRIHMTEAEQWINPRATQTKGYRDEPTKTPWPTLDHIPPAEASTAGTEHLGQEVSKVPFRQHKGMINPHSNLLTRSLPF